MFVCGLISCAMGGKSSKDIQGEGLVPRDGTDEVDVHPKKMGELSSRTRMIEFVEGLFSNACVIR